MCNRMPPCLIKFEKMLKNKGMDEKNEGEQFSVSDCDRRRSEWLVLL